MTRYAKFVLAVLLLLAVAFTGCAPAATPAPEATPTTAPAAPTATPTEVPPPPPPEEEKVLVVALGADPTFLDPESVMNNESGFVMSTIFDGLTYYEPGTSVPGPGLAESWEVSEDGTEYIFHLRQGVKFHDGTPFNADAVIAEMDRILDEDHPYYIHKQEGIHSFANFTWGLVTEYKKTDDYTVKIILSEPHAPFLASLAMAWTGIMSPAAVEEYGFDVNYNPVGTGPFKFVEWVRNDHITLEANKDYWGGAPGVDKLIFRVVPEPSVRLLKLEEGEINIMADVNPEDYERIKSNPDLVLLEQPGLTINFIGMPCELKPFDDVRVRQALNYAVDKEEMNEFLYKGAAVTMATGMPPILWGYDDSVEPYPYDPEKAKELLAEAGYPDGFDAGTMLCYENPRGYNPVGIKMSEAVQAYLKDIGVTVELQALEWGAFLDAMRSPDQQQMHMRGWSGDNGDPDNFLWELFSSDNIPIGNSSHSTNPELDEILRQARVTTDFDTRVELYKEACRIVHDDATGIFINHTLHVRATRKEVKGFLLNPLQMFFHMHLVSLED